MKNIKHPILKRPLESILQRCSFPLADGGVKTR